MAWRVYTLRSNAVCSILHWVDFDGAGCTFCRGNLLDTAGPFFLFTLAVGRESSMKNMTSGPGDVCACGFIPLFVGC